MEILNKPGAIRLHNKNENKSLIIVASDVEKKIQKINKRKEYDLSIYDLYIEEYIDVIDDYSELNRNLKDLELKYIKQYNTEEPNGYNKALTKAKPKEPDDYVHYKYTKYYFYQPGKEVYLVSPFYYPIEIEYFDIPKGETLKTMIESGKIYMSKDEEIIKNKLIKWKSLKQD